MSMNTEVGSPFNDDRKIQIVWNAGAELFKKQLTTLGISRRDDLKGQFETCKEKFLIDEQHWTVDEAKTAKPKTPSNHVDKTRGGGDIHGQMQHLWENRTQRRGLFSKSEQRQL